MTDTYIDGGGVVPDAPLPAGTRIRFVLDASLRDNDVVVHVQNGKLHVRGVNRPLDTEQVAVNALDVITLRMPSDLRRSVRPHE